MTPFQAAVLSCRILALYALYSALSTIYGLPMAFTSLWNQKLNTRDGFMGQETQWNSEVLYAFLATTILQLLVPGLFAAFLWFKAGWLALRMAFPDSSAEQARLQGRGDTQTIVIAMIGVLVLAFAVPEAARAIASALLASADPNTRADSTSRLVAENWKVLVQFLIGLGLMFCAPTFSRSMDKLVNAEAAVVPKSVVGEEAA